MILQLRMQQGPADSLLQRLQHQTLREMATHFILWRSIMKMAMSNFRCIKR